MFYYETLRKFEVFSNFNFSKLVKSGLRITDFDFPKSEIWSLLNTYTFEVFRSYDVVYCIVVYNNLLNFKRNKLKIWDIFEL